MRFATMLRRYDINLIAVIAVAAIMIFMYGQINYAVPPYSTEWNLVDYRAIAAASPGLNIHVESPFVYRILGPYIVGLLPIPDPVGFRILAAIASTVCVVLYYYFLRYFGIKGSVAALVTVLYIFNPWLFGFTSWDSFHINEILSLIYMIVLFLAMLRSKWILFALTLLLAAVTRETAMLMIPVAFFYLVEKKKLSEEGRSYALAIIPGIVVFVLLRLVMQPVAGPSLQEGLADNIGKFLSAETWFRLVIRAFIPLSLLPIIFLNRTIFFFKDKKYMLGFLVLVFVSAFFGRENERLMIPAIVVFYLLIADIVQTYLYSYRVMLALLLACGFLSSLHHEIARYPLPKTLVVVLSLVSLLVVSVASYVVTRREGITIWGRMAGGLHWASARRAKS
ncbi:MAG: hypothetical protein ACJ78Q_19250 [Chloroflexia bacterium]